jgi:hypothetical protein
MLTDGIHGQKVFSVLHGILFRLSTVQHVATCLPGNHNLAAMHYVSSSSAQGIPSNSPS